ncbi:hypothetical protein CRENBAI_020974 [Crenichthys baileyi]|uniref:Uncharacterized protein n=1 Tax=Crenichthys baileyi TaxID=28760 RepID=A0AAV9RBS5_9TELE
MLTADLTHMQRTTRDNKVQMVSLFNYGPWRRRPELDTSGGESGGSARGEATEPGVCVSAVSLIHRGWHSGAKRRALGGRTGFAQLEGSQVSQPNGSIGSYRVSVPQISSSRIRELHRKGKTLRQRSAGAVSSYTAQLMSLMSYTCLSPAPPGNRTWW